MNRPLTFEEQVLAYLDHDLDRQTSDNLMREVNCDPEKKRLLDSHTRLREMLKASHPEVKPTNSEQIGLALRLPILRQLISIQHANDAVETASEFIPWRSVIGAFDISMMILAIVGLGIALTSSMLIPSVTEDAPSAVRNVGQMSVPLRTVKLDFARTSGVRRSEFIRRLYGQQAVTNVGGGIRTLATNLMMPPIIDPVLISDGEIGMSSPVRLAGSADTIEQGLSWVDPLNVFSIVERNGHETFTAIQPVVVSDFTFKPHLSLYVGMNTNSRMYGTTDALHAASTLADGGVIGITGEIAPNVETGIELEFTDYPQLSYGPRGDTNTVTNQLVGYVSTASIRAVPGLSTKAVAGVAIASSLGFDFHVLFEGGVAFLDRPSPIAGIGFKGRCNISDNMSFVGRLILNASYVKSEVGSGDLFNGLSVDRSKEQPYLLTPGVLAGFGFQYSIF